jgi:hypothetical protein
LPARGRATRLRGEWHRQVGLGAGERDAGPATLREQALTRRAGAWGWALVGQWENGWAEEAG